MNREKNENRKRRPIKRRKGNMAGAATITGSLLCNAHPHSFSLYIYHFLLFSLLSILLHCCPSAASQNGIVLYYSLTNFLNHRRILGIAWSKTELQRWFHRCRLHAVIIQLSFLNAYHFFHFVASFLPAPLPFLFFALLFYILKVEIIGVSEGFCDSIFLFVDF